MRYDHSILCKAPLPVTHRVSAVVIATVLISCTLECRLSNVFLVPCAIAGHLQAEAAQGPKQENSTGATRNVSDSAQGKTDAIDPKELVRKCQKSYEKVKDFTATFIRRERVHSELKEVETIELKFRKKPFSIYLKWIENPHKGREVLYVKGQNKGKIIAHTGGPIDINLKRTPEDKNVMSENREPITRLGIGHVISSLAGALEESESGKKSAFQLLYLGTERIPACAASVAAGRSDDVEAYRLLAITHAENDENPFYFVMVKIDKEELLPTRIACYDKSYMLQAYYAYENLKLNTGLTKNDFDPRNKKYSFYRFPINLNPFE